MTDKLTLNDLTVSEPYYDRPATLSDLVEVIESLGGEVRTAVPHGVPTYALFIQGPGRYAILPIPEGTPDE